MVDKTHSIFEALRHSANEGAVKDALLGDTPYEDEDDCPECTNDEPKKDLSECGDDEGQDDEEAQKNEATDGEAPEEEPTEEEVAELPADEGANTEEAPAEDTEEVVNLDEVPEDDNAEVTLEYEEGDEDPEAKEADESCKNEASLEVDAAEAEDFKDELISEILNAIILGDDSEEVAADDVVMDEWNPDAVAELGEALTRYNAPSAIQKAYESRLFERCATWLGRTQHVTIDLREGFSKSEFRNICKQLKGAPREVKEALILGRYTAVNSYLESRK